MYAYDHHQHHDFFAGANEELFFSSSCSTSIFVGLRPRESLEDCCDVPNILDSLPILPDDEEKGSDGQEWQTWL